MGLSGGGVNRMLLWCEHAVTDAVAGQTRLFMMCSDHMYRATARGDGGATVEGRQKQLEMSKNRYPFSG